MDKTKIILTPEEMYQMSILMDAEYLDYGYVASIETTGVSPDLVMRESSGKLTEKGLVEEDFSGDIEIPQEIRDLFAPVFFGKTETALVRVFTGEDPTVVTVRFHFHEGRITCTECRDGMFSVSEADDVQIDALIEDVFGETDDMDAEYDPACTDMIVSVKTGTVGGRSVVNAFIKSNGAFFEEKDRDFVRAGADELKERASKILKGRV